jgi:predicted nucleic acid-binding protein
LVGVLKIAKAGGEKGAIRPLLDQLRDIAGFRISVSLYEHVLIDVGEWE